MLPDTSARLFLLPPQDMGMLGKGGRSRIPAVNFPFSTIPGNSLQYCIVRNLNEVGYWRGWQSGGLGYFSLWCRTVTLVTALLKYSEYFEVDVAEHSTRACIDTRMGQNPLNGPKFQGCWPSYLLLPACFPYPPCTVYLQYGLLTLTSCAGRVVQHLRYLGIQIQMQRESGIYTVCWPPARA